MSHPAPVNPFWNQLPEIIRYPFQGAALISLIVLSLCSVLGLLPGIGWLLRIVLWLAAYRYAFEILLRTAHGRMDPPEITANTDSGVVMGYLGLWIIFFVLVIAAALLFGPFGMILAMLVLTLALPGCIISLAIDGVLGHALNPATPLAIMSRIGAPYFAAFVLLFVIQASAAVAEYWLTQTLPLLSVPLAAAVTLWGLFAAFHLMGYLVHQFGDALGFEPQDAFKRPALRNRDTDLMEETEALVADGQIGEAVARLHAEMRERAVPMEAHELYRKLLHARGEQAELLEHAGLYLNLLMLEKHDRRALGIVRESLDADRNFTPQQVEDAQLLARRARDSGQARLAVDLWMAMIKRWPRDPARVDWALEVSEVLARRDKVTLARQVLEYVSRGVDEASKARIDAALASLPSDG